MSISNATPDDIRTLSPAGKEQGVLARLSHVFKRADQKASDFVPEVRALTHQDKMDFARWFRELGLETSDPMVTPS